MRGKSLYLPKKFKLLSLLLLLITIFIPIFFPQYLGSLTHADPYDNFYEAFKRMIVFSVAIPISVLFINICPNTSWTAQQGKLTMQYYIYHALIITILMFCVNKLNIPMSFISATIYTVFIIIGIGIASRTPHFNKFTNLSSFLKI